MTWPRTAPAHQSAPARGQVEVPVVLPHVVMTVAADGSMAVTVDGQEYPPPQFAPPWTRASFAPIVDGLLGERACPLRVEVHESDGTAFTDIITPRPRRVPQPDPLASAEAAPPARVVPQVVEVTGEGFIPGEDIAVGVVTGHSDADGDGVVRALLTGDQAATSPTGEVILLGRVSGVVVVGRLG
jgi:hypothetical protein